MKFFIMAYSNFYARFYHFCQKVGQAVVLVWRIPTSRWLLIVIAFFQLLAWSQALLIRRSLTGDFLVLHYNVDFGIDLVGSPTKIFIYPLVGLGILLLNFILAVIIGRRSQGQLATNLLLLGAAVFGLFLSLALLSIYLINFR